jgi:hypothetical protein
LVSAIEDLKEIQVALNERGEKIRERITSLISGPLNTSLTEKEKTYVNTVTEYAFDEETKIERDPVDGGIAYLIEKLEQFIADGE